MALNEMSEWLDGWLTGEGGSSLLSWEGMSMVGEDILVVVISSSV
jgi:hypothetical protein